MKTDGYVPLNFKMSITFICDDIMMITMKMKTMNEWLWGMKMNIHAHSCVSQDKRQCT